MEPHTQMFRATTAPSTTWASYPKPELQSAPKSELPSVYRNDAYETSNLLNMSPSLIHMEIFQNPGE